MNKLFGLILLALAFLPGGAEAANRFAVCATTCTWDNSSTAMWSTSSGGATGAAAPTSSDDVILDAATCVGGTTCTITTFAGTISVANLTQSACTASTAGCILDAATNNTNFVISGSTGYANTGSGTRTLNMGTGTWTISGNTGSWNIAASMTLSAASSTIEFTGAAAASRTFAGGAKTYGTVMVSAIGTGIGQFAFTASNTFGTLTVSAPNRLSFGNGTTQTITTLTNISGSASSPTLISGNVAFGVGAIASANNWVCDYCGLTNMSFSGGGTFSATNSYDFKNNSGITITPPAGTGGGRIIGG
jgi:hypothetical protein